MKATIPASAIGNFSSVEQKRLYDKMTSIMQPVKEVADQFVACDNQPPDANTRAGSVLLDGHYQGDHTYTGVCLFDPATKELGSLDAQVKHEDFSQIDLDADFTWSSSGGRPGVSYAHYSVQRSEAGVVTWSGPQGSVHVNADGSLFMDS